MKLVQNNEYYYVKLLDIVTKYNLDADKIFFDSEFNASAWTTPCIRPKVIHYAAIPKEQYVKDWAYQKYDAINLIIGREDDEQGEGD